MILGQPPAPPTHPLGRLFHTAVWTGSDMILWGGWNEIELSTGSRYNPSTDSWTATSTTNAPAARLNHTAVWTGNEMIVWGGWNGRPIISTPAEDTIPALTVGQPPAPPTRPMRRYYHTAVWTGSEMIVWGGWNAAQLFQHWRQIQSWHRQLDSHQHYHRAQWS